MVLKSLDSVGKAGGGNPGRPGASSARVVSINRTAKICLLDPVLAWELQGRRCLGFLPTSSATFWEAAAFGQVEGSCES